MIRHQLPINDALLNKMIDRLDTFHSDSVRYDGSFSFYLK